MAKLAAKVYADALLEAARESGKLDASYEEVVALKNIFAANPGLRDILESPKIVREDKLAAVKEIFASRISDEVMGFLTAIIEKGRQAELEQIFDFFIVQVKELKGIGTAYIKSASELSGLQKEAVKRKLLETTAYKEFEMNYSVDESLIGGLVIRINDRVADSSIKTRIYEMKKELLKLQL